MKLTFTLSMSQPFPQKQFKPRDQTQNPNPNHPFLECAELVLLWLTPPELANVSSTCKTLNQIAKSITRRRSVDASRSFETLPIPFLNAIDHRPYSHFIYTPTQILAYSPSSSQFQPRQSWGSNPSPRPSSLSQTHSESENRLGLECTTSRIEVGSLSLVDESGEIVCGCDCENCEEVGDGMLGCPCVGLEELGLMSECGARCGCGLECKNRLTQRGVSARLKIVRDEKKGWGLFADQLIQKGKFVCEYAGELLTTKEARIRQQMYDKLSSGSRFSSALLVVREHLPSGKASLRMNIDATRVGNVGRFINHSCDGGNLSTILVRNSGALLPRLCFFASKDIKDDEELTFSYGETRLRSKGLQCFCGTSCCNGILPSEHT